MNKNNQKELMDKNQSTNLFEPPKGVIKGDSIPQENEEEDWERILHKAREIRRKKREVGIEMSLKKE